uniref:Uncharacterized protein n=1 Tax=Solanum tuberosum TaxID=4113 RepID=M1A9Y3_SOLTU
MKILFSFPDQNEQKGSVNKSTIGFLMRKPDREVTLVLPSYTSNHLQNMGREEYVQVQSRRLVFFGQLRYLYRHRH